MSTCKTCKNAEWQRGPKGGISRSLSGVCTAPIRQVSVTGIPASVVVIWRRIAIWPADGTNCSTYEPK